MSDLSCCHTCGGSGFVRTLRLVEASEVFWTVRGVDLCPDCRGEGQR